MTALNELYIVDAIRNKVEVVSVDDISSSTIVTLYHLRLGKLQHLTQSFAQLR